MKIKELKRIIKNFEDEDNVFVVNFHMEDDKIFTSNYEIRSASSEQALGLQLELFDSDITMRNVIGQRMESESYYLDDFDE